MALKVWLPLTGDLENIGVSDYTINVFRGSEVYDNNGKIGKCFYSNGVNTLKILNIIPDFYNYTGYSLCAWLYIEAQNTTHTGAAVISAGNWNQQVLNLAVSDWSTDHYTRLRISGTSWSGTYSYNFAKNTWYHVVVCSDGTKTYAYVNGTLIGDTATGFLPTSIEGNDMCIGGATYYAGMQFFGKINDVRIYDHCLSPKEVKEISQALIIHYRLNGAYGGVGENLAYGTNTANTSTNTWRLSLQAGGTANSIEYDGDTPVAVITRNNVEWTGWSYLHYDNIHAAEIKPSTTYTISFDIMPSVDGNITFTGLCQGNATNYKTQSTSVIQGTCTANKWNHIIVQCITKSDFTDLNDSQVIYLNCAAAMKATGVTLKMKNMKMEEGSIATAWLPATSEIGIDNTKVVDSSGYGHYAVSNGSTEVTIVGDSTRYGLYTNFSSGSRIATPIGTASFMPTDQVTCCVWFKSTASANRFFSCTEGGGWNFESVSGYVSFPIYIKGKGYTRVDSTKTTWASLNDNNWHMLAATYDRTNTSLYIDGILDQQTASSYPGIDISYNANTPFTLGAEAQTIASPIAGTFVGGLSDVRIYATALSAADVLELYNTPANIDNLNNMHTFEFLEDAGNSISKNGLTHTKTITQYDEISKYCQYDNALYFEPDGSAWIHIYHHNDPGAGSFASTDTFSTGVYKDANRWFDGTQVCNALPQWEFLIKYAYTAGGTEYKERWIQSKNPEQAVFADVAAASITRITGSDYKAGSWGGLYKKNSSAYWVMNNGQSSNWWGATGPFSVYQSGSPSYGGTVTTTGYDDLYVRIDNIPLTNFSHASIVEDGTYKANNFIEK